MQSCTLSPVCGEKSREQQCDGAGGFAAADHGVWGGEDAQDAFRCVGETREAEEREEREGRGRDGEEGSRMTVGRMIPWPRRRRSVWPLALSEGFTTDGSSPTSYAVSGERCWRIPRIEPHVTH